MLDKCSLPSLFRRVLLGMFLIVLALLALGWTALESGWLSDQRRGIVSKILTDQIGQPVEVSGDIRLRLGLKSKVWIEQVAVQSKGMSDVDVLQIGTLRFDVDTWELIQSRIDWDNFILSGAKINFLKETDGRKSWVVGETSTEQNNPQSGLLELLRDKHVEVTNSSLTIDYQDTGFFFNYLLDDFQVLQQNGARLTLVDGHGSLNGQDFGVEGEFPAEAAFSATLQVGSTVANLSGSPLSGSGGQDYIADLYMEIASVGDFLEAVGLKRTSEGKGTLQAELKGRAGSIAVPSLEISIDGDEGRQLRIGGSIDELFRLQGTDLQVSLIFQNPAPLFQPNNQLFEVSLEEISAQISGDPSSFELNEISIKTSAFNEKLSRIGPMEVEKLFVTEDGELSLTGIRLVAGDADSPYLTVDGEITNALELKGFDLRAKLRTEATDFFPFHSFADENALGLIIGDLLVSDDTGALSVNNLNLKTAETDLWDATVSATVGDLERLGNLGTTLRLHFKHPADFLKLLGVQSEISDPIALNWVAQSNETAALDITTSIAFASTDIKAKMIAGFPDDAPTLDGDISGASLHVLDIRKLVGLGKSIAGVVQGPYANRTSQPLVIERTTKSLVIPREAEPLVLGSPKEALKIDKLVSDAEVELRIDISRILGIAALNKINAVLHIDEGTAQLEPVVLSAVGGAATASVTSDLKNAPSKLRAKGTLQGIGLSTLMQLANVGIDAEGSISGPFDVSFDIKRMSNLLRSASGNTQLHLKNGKVATSLLNLAGLGVIPWLFSKELQAGYTDVTCASVPIVFSRGIVSVDNTVVETPSVQVLVNGQINMLNETLYIRAVPRPLKRTNARSPFPITISGPLKNPELKIVRGEDSQRRSPHPSDKEQVRQDCRK